MSCGGRVRLADVRTSGTAEDRYHMLSLQPGRPVVASCWCVGGRGRPCSDHQGPDGFVRYIFDVVSAINYLDLKRLTSSMDFSQPRSTIQRSFRFSVMAGSALTGAYRHSFSYQKRRLSPSRKRRPTKLNSLCEC